MPSCRSNRRHPKGILSLLDVPRTAFVLGVGKLSPAFYGLKLGLQGSGSAGRKFGAVGLGLLLSVPLLAAVIPLLIKADAAFDGLLQNLPDWDRTEVVVSVLFGCLLACFLYVRSTALCHSPKTASDTKTRKPERTSSLSCSPKSDNCFIDRTKEGTLLFSLLRPKSIEGTSVVG